MANKNFAMLEDGLVEFMGRVTRRDFGTRDRQVLVEARASLSIQADSP